jgi:hypothetical protein
VLTGFREHFFVIKERQPQRKNQPRMNADEHGCNTKLPLSSVISVLLWFSFGGNLVGNVDKM